MKLWMIALFAAGMYAGAFGGRALLERSAKAEGGRVVRSVSCYDLTDRPVPENSNKPGYCILREAKL